MPSKAKTTVRKVKPSTDTTLRKLIRPGGPLSLESVLITEELQTRPARAPEYRKDSEALVSLTEALAEAPRTILQALADKLLEVLGCHSTGLSFVTGDGKWFYWPAIAGVWRPHIGGGTPRDFGPCGDVLDLDSPLLFREFQHRYEYFTAVSPTVNEALLIPFYVNGRAAGTLWAVTHDDRPGRPFDSEDLRLLKCLGKFASAAYKASEWMERCGRVVPALPPVVLTLIRSVRGSLPKQ